MASAAIPRSSARRSPAEPCAATPELIDALAAYMAEAEDRENGLEGEESTDDENDLREHKPDANDEW